MEPVYFIPPAERRRMLLASQADSSSVLIYGAGGTGKGAIAKWIHRQSPRSLRPFVEWKPGASLEEALRSAQGGSLVVTELSELTQQEQKQLLDFLKNHTVPHPKNRSLPLLVQVRIMALTNADIPARVAGGLFLEELLERVSIFSIHVPSLSHRGEEFTGIAHALLGEIARELRKPYVRKIHPDALKHLQSHHWSGNIRELRNVLKLAVSRSQHDDLQLNDLPTLDAASINFHATREEFEKIYFREILVSFQGNLEETAQACQLELPELKAKLASLGLLP